MGNNPNNAPQQRESGSKKLVLIAVAGVMFLALGGGGFWYASHQSLPFVGRPTRTTSRTRSKDAPPVAVFQLQSFVVNLADPDHSAFLRIGIALGLEKPLAASGDSEKNSPYTPQVRDAVLGVLSTWKSQDLLAPEGRTKLKKQLLKTLQQKIPEMGVTDIYFTDYLVQQ
ncbi:MAG: flagellar basal body-associated FliL family protein [Acidobacteriota bacterium]